MTNEEATREIESYMPKDEPVNARDREAFFMAIAALKAAPCEDAVSRDVILDKIKEVCFSKEQKWVDFRVSQGSNGQRDFIINFIESLPPVAPKQEWIHVSEGSPKESGEYLVSVIDEYDGNYEAVGVARYDVEEGEWQDLGVDRTVIAWEPKPAPYREGGEG